MDSVQHTETTWVAERNRGQLARSTETAEQRDTRPAPVREAVAAAREQERLAGLDDLLETHMNSLLW